MLGYVTSNDIAHVSFDFWNTLVASNSEFKNHRNRLVAALSDDLSIGQVDQVFAAVGRAYNSTMIAGNATIDARYLYAEVLGRLSIPLNHTEEVCQESYRLFIKHAPLRINSHLWELINVLNKEGITTSLTSNTAFVKGTAIEAFLKSLELDKQMLFNVYSDQVGYGKPHAAIFDELLNRLHVMNRPIQASRILHIGDDPICDKKGAEQMGMHAILIDS